MIGYAVSHHPCGGSALRSEVANSSFASRNVASHHIDYDLFAFVSRYDDWSLRLANHMP